jgi:indolepyruvate ferredoxin oxidoreductase
VLDSAGDRRRHRILEPRTLSEVDLSYTLEDALTRRSGRVYLTGVQALVRLPLMQRQRDEAAGLDTAGFISGYRGSPLGTYDLALWRARQHLEEHRIRFEPGVNEDLAATAVWGSQQAGLYEGPRTDGVFGIWYGKGPGVDRSCDALKHANYAGTAPHGGVLALCGDDPAARSSSIAHQSEPALVHCGIPILNPSDVQDYLDLGLLGFALSRYSGCWVGFKCLTDTVDSARSVDVDPARIEVVLPSDFELPPGGLSIGWSNLPLAVEARLFRQRHLAAQAFVRANGLDRVVWDAPRRRLGIVTTGKAYLDVRQALEELGIDEARARDIGLGLYKVALSWPLEPEGALGFAEGREDLLVVEEKRSFVEDQLARLLYNVEGRPRLLGKTDETGAPLLSAEGELAPSEVASVLRGWLERRVPELRGRLTPPVRVELPDRGGAAALMRLPSFCSGCPHSTSTHVPEQSVALGGIGCHGMAVWLPDRRTLAVTQMGGEGANWIPGRRHLLPLRAPGRARCRYRRRQHHLQGARQRRRGDDGRPAHRGREPRGRGDRAGDRPTARSGGCRPHRSRDRSARQVHARGLPGRGGRAPPRPARPYPARAPRGARRDGHRLRPDLRGRGAAPAQARGVPGSRSSHRDQRAGVRGLR